MVLTTLRIGGRATYTCEQGFALKGDHDIECLSSGSWSSWPPQCVEIDCGQPEKIENGRVFLTNRTTTMSSIVEYHCFPGYDRDGPFERVCGEDGYWSGVEPSCQKPRPILPVITDNTIDGAENIRSGPAVTTDSEDTSSVGTWIGVALGLIVVIGLLVLGVYFYRKKRAMTSKPPPYRDSRGPSVPTNGEYIMSSVYGGVSNGSNGSMSNGNGTHVNGVHPPTVPNLPNRIGQRPPPPIQMYGMDDSGNAGGTEDHRGPIYDTINDDSSGSGYSRSNPGSDKGHYAPTSTFTPNGNGYPPQTGPRTNGGFVNEYDVPEGSEQQLSGSSRNSVGAVTINGIAV